jgi:hypothetical protein
MKPIVYICIKRWRENNPIRYKEQCRQYMQKQIAWKSVATEFRKILIKEHLPDFVETRGRPKNPPRENIEKIKKKIGRPKNPPKEPKPLAKRGRPKRL